jgi:hypothetical protein
MERIMNNEIKANPTKENNNKPQNKQVTNQPTAQTQPAVKKNDNVVSISNAGKDKNVAADAAAIMSQGIEAATRLITEGFAISREQFEACVEASGIAAECAQHISESISESANIAISENVEHLKDFFNCRTASDVFSLQNRLAQLNMDIMFNNHRKVSEMLFNYSNKASEPFADKINDYSDRIGKIFK